MYFSLNANEKKFSTLGEAHENTTLQELKEDLQGLSRQLVKSYADKYFVEEFKRLLEKEGISQPKLENDLQKKFSAIDRKTSIDDVPKEWKRAFAVARGKAKGMIIDQEAVLYSTTDKDIPKEIEENFVPSKPSQVEKGLKVETHLRQPVVPLSKFINTINLTTGKIIGENNRNFTNLNLSDFYIYQIDAVLKHSNKEFSDFTLTSIEGSNIIDDETIETMDLFSTEEQPFQPGSDASWAYIGTPVGQSKGFLAATHSKALKGVKPISVRMDMDSKEIICEFG